jgi:hypothetical protein
MIMTTFIVSGRRSNSVRLHHGSPQGAKAEVAANILAAIRERRA